MSDNILEYSIRFKHQGQCDDVHDALNLLCEDNHTQVWEVFKGQKGRHLLSNAIEGLMVFLSCKRDQNILRGSFYSSALELDGQVFKDYIHEANAEANINIQPLSAMG